MLGAKRTRPAPLHLLGELGGQPRLWLQRGNVCRLHCSPEPNGVLAHPGQLTLWKTKQQNPHHLDSGCFTKGDVAQPKPSLCGRLRQEDRHQFQASLGFSGRHGLKKNPHPQTKQNPKSASKSLSACKMHETQSPFSGSSAVPRWAGRRGGASVPHFRFRSQKNSPATGKERLSARVFLPV